MTAGRRPWARPLAVGAVLAALPLAAVPWRQRLVTETRPYGQPARLPGRDVRTVRAVAPAWAPPRAASARGTDWATDTRSDLGAPRVDWPSLAACWAAVAAGTWAWGRRAAARAGAAADAPRRPGV
jgi:hypothetical protein